MPLRAVLLTVAIVACVVGFFALVIGVGAMRLAGSRDEVVELSAPAPATRPAPDPASPRVGVTSPATAPAPPHVASPGKPVFAVDLPRPGGPVSLTADEALVHGKSIKVHNRRKRGGAFVGSWDVREDYAEWSAVVPRAGGYAVELTYTREEEFGGKFELVIGDVAIAARAEGTGEDGSMVSLGALALPAGQTRVLVRPAGPMRGELMKLRRVDLFPLDAGAFALARKAAARRLPPPGSVVTLAAAKAILNGEALRRDGEHQDVTDWHRPQDTVEWAFDSPGGTFHVDLTYACEFEEPRRFAVSVAGQQVRGRTALTGTWEDYDTARLGTVAVPKGPARLVIRCTDRESEGAMVMNVRRVELVRVDAAPPPAPAVAAMPAPRDLGAGGAEGDGDVKRPAALPISGFVAEPIFLPAELAGLHGSEIRLEPEADDEDARVIGFWRDPAEHVEWVVHLRRPARYHVFLAYACAAGHGGEFTLTTAGGAAAFKGKVKGEGAWTDRRTMSLGAVKLPAGNTPLLLKPARPMPDGRALMKCRGLLLLPAGE